MRNSRRSLTVAFAILTASVLCAGLALATQAQKRRPILILTQNGQVVVKIVGPKGATDVHVFWGGPGVPEGGGFGYWTKNGQEMPKSRFQFGSNINDIHFSPTGRVPRLPPIPAPPEANDVEIGWEEDGQITEAFWTKDGHPLAAIPVTGEGQELSVRFNRQGSQTPPGAATVGLLPGYHVDSNTANGLYVTTVTTPQGKIKVNLPDDIAAGDTISGTVETEPAGKNDAERAQNQAELNGYVIELEGQKTKVGDKKISCNIPIVLTAGGQTIIIQHNGQPVATTEIPISVTRPPTPNQLTLPTGGQQGRTFECGGNFAPTDLVKIGGTILPPIAGSPRKLVVNNTSEVVGPTIIECSQHGVVSQCPFRNIGIKLSAPKLSLRRGETTTLHVTVTGLAGITQDVSLDLVDSTPNVIKMSGGEVQHLNIQPTQVEPDGTAAFDRTLTGNTTGAFGVTGTVRWADVCKRP